MEIYQLRAFATAARLGNLTRTAEALHLTQPAITAQIKALEEDLGVSLFERRPGGISLTRAGEMLLADAEQILHAAGHMQGRARELQGQVTGQLVLGTLADPEMLRLGSTLSSLAEQFPLLEIKTRNGPAEELLEMVISGLLPASYYIGIHLPRDLGGLTLRTLHYRIVGAARERDALLAASWHELADRAWIGASPRHHVQVLLHALFARQGLASRHIIESDESSLSLSLARSGAGLALVREELATLGSEAGDVVIWPHARVAAHLCFVHSRAAEHEPAVVAALSAVRKVWNLGPAR